MRQPLYTALTSQQKQSSHRTLKATLLVVLAAGLFSLIGCGSSADDAGSVGDVPTSSASAGSSASAPAAGGAPSGASNQQAQTISTLAASAIPRKIIYNATVDLVADNLSTAQQLLMQIVKTHKGYVAETDIGGAAGSRREGTWKIRVPVDQFNDAMGAIAKLGELQTTHTESQDVSEKYYDLVARISNKQVEEKRLLMHLQKSTARLHDILDVEHELSRVRGEIEEMQGQFRVLANLTALATITVAIHEIKEYVPPKLASFGVQVFRAFTDSLHALRDVIKAITLVLVSSVPWLVVAALMLSPILWFKRRTHARRQRNFDSHFSQRPPDSASNPPSNTMPPDVGAG